MPPWKVHRIDFNADPMHCHVEIDQHRDEVEGRDHSSLP